jgi:peptide/nickel transport system substrate-binding protein
VAQDRIVFERYAGYWNKDAIHFERVTYLPVVDNTVRLANLQAGQLDFIERVAPSDIPQVSKDNRFKVARLTGLGYQGITINLAKSDMAQKNPLGRDPRVREAFELSLDRDAIVQVAMEGEAAPGNAWVSPKNPYYPKNIPIPKRDVAKAKALLKDAGVPNPSFTLMTPTTNEAQKLAQIVQAMASEAGFDVKIQATEFSTSLDLADKGQFEAYVLEWSGRSDPDGNVYPHLYTNGAINYAGYSKPETDTALDDARRAADQGERLKDYGQFAAIESKDRPIVYLYHRNWLWAYTAKLNGLRPVPDGLVRLQGLKLN